MVVVLVLSMLSILINVDRPCIAFLQYNYLNEVLPQYEELPRRLLRSAFIGFCSSFVSDTCSNSIRVIKTTRQTSNVATSYPEVIKVWCDFITWAFV